VLKDGNSERLELATREGFMQALPDRVTVIVDEAVRFDDVDVAKSREEAASEDPIVAEFASAKLRLTGH
jgi:F0F1-type ATP synthase epsilon subunit